MTDKDKVAVIAMAVLLIAALAMTGAYFGELTQQNQVALNRLYIKRDDIVSQQHRLEALLQDLNNTLAYEVTRQNALSAKLASLSAEKAALLSAQKQTVLTPPPPQAPVLTPAPVSVPTTRAS